MTYKISIVDDNGIHCHTIYRDADSCDTKNNMFVLTKGNDKRVIFMMPVHKLGLAEAISEKQYRKALREHRKTLKPPKHINNKLSKAVDIE